MGKYFWNQYPLLSKTENIQKYDKKLLQGQLLVTQGFPEVPNL